MDVSCRLGHRDDPLYPDRRTPFLHPPTYIYRPPSQCPHSLDITTLPNTTIYAQPPDGPKRGRRSLDKARETGTSSDIEEETMGRILVGDRISGRRVSRQ